MMTKTLLLLIIFSAMMPEMNIQSAAGFGKTLEGVTEKTRRRAGMLVLSGQIKIGINQLGIEYILNPDSGREYCCKILIKTIKSDRVEVRDFKDFFCPTWIWQRASS